ncbi:MAG TPA: hypothetical protein VG621_01385 [Candidatus Paceibacterota bacterium]|nr:hypothetical protein [Candidatus Paceibacterota bacterium]
MPLPSAGALFIHLLIAIGALIVVAKLAWNLWLSYIQTEFLRSVKWVLLEIRPPKDVFKSPAAMELVLNSLYQTGGTGNWYDKYWKGNLRNCFSLEIASLEGRIHFYIRTSEKFRKLIESQIYAQYPQAEVVSVTDYTKEIPGFTKGGPIALWGCNFELTNKEEVYPIKTYVDYGLDRAVGSLEEEERIDPITSMLEFMGSIGVGEYIWFQIIIRAATNRFVIKGKEGNEEAGKAWTDRVKQVIKDFNEGLVEYEKDAEGKKKKVGSRRATKGEQQVIEAIERNANKLGFDSGIRAVYVTRSEHFDANRISGLTGMLRQYSAADYNSFKPANTTSFDFPWQDLLGNKIVKKKARMLGGYKARGYFYGKFSFKKIGKYFTHPNQSGGKPFILSTEELATLYHLPGRVVETPTFVRIESKRGEPPANLPV